MSQKIACTGQQFISKIKHVIDLFSFTKCIQVLMFSSNESLNTLNSAVWHRNMVFFNCYSVIFLIQSCYLTYLNVDRQLQSLWVIGTLTEMWQIKLTAHFHAIPPVTIWISSDFREVDWTESTSHLWMVIPKFRLRRKFSIVVQSL